MEWEPLGVPGIGNLFLGLAEECPASPVECRGSFVPFPTSGLEVVKVYLCHPAGYPTPCIERTLPDGRPWPRFLFSRLSPDAEVRSWVVEVEYPGDLELRFSWDVSGLPGPEELNLVIVDPDRKIAVNNPPPGIPPYRLSMVRGDETTAFLICSQAVGTPTSSSCPNSWP